MSLASAARALCLARAEAEAHLSAASAAAQAEHAARHALDHAAAEARMGAVRARTVAALSALGLPPRVVTILCGTSRAQRRAAKRVLGRLPAPTRARVQAILAAHAEAAEAVGADLTAASLDGQRAQHAAEAEAGRRYRTAAHAADAAFASATR